MANSNGSGHYTVAGEISEPGVLERPGEANAGESVASKARGGYNERQRFDSL